MSTDIGCKYTEPDDRRSVVWPSFSTEFSGTNPGLGVSSHQYVSVSNKEALVDNPVHEYFAPIAYLNFRLLADLTLRKKESVPL